MLQTIWGWQPALYLFLGGMGSGAFAVAAMLYLRDKDHNKKIICASMWAAVASLVVGLLLLVSELTNPLRGMMMWQSFVNGTSWMTIGAWGLFATVAVFGVSALLATMRAASPRRSPARHPENGEASPLPADDAEASRFSQVPVERLLSILSGVGIALAVFVAAYTGVLLMSAPGVPLWNTPLLPCLFLVSGFDTGVALVEVIAFALARREGLTQKGHQLVTKLTVGFIAAEVVIMAALFATMLASDAATPWGATAAASAEMLLGGILAPYFWILVVGLGLALPLVCAGVALARHGKSGESGNGGRALSLVGAAGVLVGGCELRFLVLAAGLHADLVMSAFASVVG